MRINICNAKFGPIYIGIIHTEGAKHMNYCVMTLDAQFASRIFASAGSCTCCGWIESWKFLEPFARSRARIPQRPEWTPPCARSSCGRAADQQVGPHSLSLRGWAKNALSGNKGSAAGEQFLPSNRPALSVSRDQVWFPNWFKYQTCTHSGSEWEAGEARRKECRSC